MFSQRFYFDRTFGSNTDLAAVALPQYQKAVEKSKGMQAVTLLRSLFPAVTDYYLANGIYPTKFNQLPIDIPWTGTQKWHDSGTRTTDTKSNADWAIQIYNNGTDFRLWVGRISGPYAGTGFSADSKGNITCVEDAHKNNNFIFSNPKGSYCEKIFRAIHLNGGDDAMRYYALP